MKKVVIVVLALVIALFAGEYIDLTPRMVTDTIVYQEDGTADEIQFIIDIDWKSFSANTEFSVDRGEVAPAVITSRSRDSVTVTIHPLPLSDSQGTVDTVTLIATSSGIELGRTEFYIEYLRDNDFMDNSNITIFENAAPLDSVNDVYLHQNEITDFGNGFVEIGCNTRKKELQGRESINQKAFSIFHDNGWTSFDGMKYKSYPLKTYTKRIDNDGNIWMTSTKSYIYYFKKHSANDYIFFSKENGLPEGYIREIHIDKDNRFWVRVNGSICIIENEEVKYIDDYSSVDENGYFPVLLIDSSGNMATFSDSAQAIYTGKGTDWKKLNYAELGITKDIKNIVLAPNNSIAVIYDTTKIAVISSDGSVRKIPELTMGPLTDLNIFAASNGDIWAYGDDYIHRFDGTFWSSYDIPLNLADIKEDAEGNIWIAHTFTFKSAGEGLYSYYIYNSYGVSRYSASTGKWEQYQSKSYDLASNMVSSFKLFPNGDFWLEYAPKPYIKDGTVGYYRHYGVAKYENGKWISAVDSYDTLESSTFKTLKYNDDGNPYISHGKELFVMNNSGWHKQVSDKWIVFDGKTIKERIIDGNGHHWYIFENSTDVARVTPPVQTTSTTAKSLTQHKSIKMTSQGLELSGVASGKGEVAIYSLNGRTLYKASLNFTGKDKLFSIPKGLARGMYIINVKAPSVKFNQKFVVK